jgi:glutathione S-transferase
MMLKVWGRANSSNVQSVMWCIGELGLAHERIDAGHRFGGLDTPEFLAMNPNGTVPVLQVRDGPTLWESGAILRYLGSRFGQAPFWPGDPNERAPVDQWAEWAKINVAIDFARSIFVPLVRTPADRRDPAAIRAAVASLGKRLDIAEARLSRHAFLVSDAMTLADIVFGHVLFRYFDLDIERPRHPAVRAYFDRLAQRPAYRKHVMVSYDELKVT